MNASIYGIIQPTKYERGGDVQPSLPMAFSERTAEMHDDAITIPLTRGKVAVIDAADRELVSRFRWYAAPRGRSWYAQSDIGTGRTDRRKVYLHRLLMDPPAGIDVDHIDGDGLNCRRSNMRCATRAQNLANQRRRIGSISGYKGVSLHHSINWQVKVTKQGETVSLSGFKTPEEAARAYDKLAREIHGEFARLNFPDESD